MKLFCLPFAGGGASGFRCLRDAMPKRIEVVPMALPGREHRYAEALVDDIQVLVADLAERYLRTDPGPYAIYGHSMGSLIGLELIRYLIRHSLALPRRFFAAARGAPAFNGEYERFSEFDDERLIARVKAFGGLPDKIAGNREIMAMVLPVLRSDFRLLDRYQYLDGEPLPLPIHTFHGRHDATVQESWIKAWRYESAAGYRHDAIPGNHFFLGDPRSPLFDILVAVLDEESRALAPCA
jgi:surfactin synthase thioesterase subunit